MSTEQIYTVATFEGKIEIQFFQGVVPAVTVVIAKTIYCFIATEAWKYLKLLKTGSLDNAFEEFSLA